MDDELQEVRDHFYIGSFARCMEIIGNTSPSGDFQAAELATYKAKTFLGMKKFGELKALKDSPIPGEQSTAIMTIFMNSKPDRQQTAKDSMMELVKNSKDMAASYMAAVLLAHQEEYVEGINLISSYDTLDMKTLKAQLYLLMRRPDLADPVIKDIGHTAEDAAVTKMITSLYNVAIGNHQEAFLTYCDLQALFGEEANETPSTILLCAKAACNLHRGLYAEALEDIQAAIALNPKDPDLMINMACANVHTDPGNAWQQQLGGIKEKFPAHPFMTSMTKLDEALAAFRWSS